MSNKTISNASLLRLNQVGLWLHLLQGVTMVALVAALDTNKSYDITVNFLSYDVASQSLLPATQQLFSINFAWLVASFLFMSALAHVIITTVYQPTYLANLKKGINKARWYEYSVSASTMMVAIALLSGMSDLASLLMLFTLVAVMNLLGLVMEVVNQGKNRPEWLSYVVGCIAGIVPWIAFGIYVWAANMYSENGVPGFVYGIYASIFLFFNCFAINMWLQYKRIGKWANYLYGEKVYIVLSLVAKSALAWQVFGGVFQP
ncbi:heliorhodopsin HeR [Candidatus Saccharibacteria bacterium]|nr:heliorhodopsin HeR [Candidatus Saccharibacteria bacterium]